MGYLLDHCILKRLTPELIDQCLPYECGKDNDIDSFFHNETKDNFEDYLSERMCTPYCFITEPQEENDKPKMVCAFSLSTSSIRVSNLPKPRRNRFNKNIPNGKRKPQYPAVLIGQLCVFDGFGSHAFETGDIPVGDEMMNLIKTMVFDDGRNIVARYLVVDAINKPNVIEYYKRNGFVFLIENEADELYYLKGYDSLSLQERISRFFNCSSRRQIHCKTRYMVFDLILLKP